VGTKRTVVIGAGVIGAAVALRLAQRGNLVTLVDAGRPGGGTSGTSFAWLNANAKIPRGYFELNLWGMRAHRALANELGGTWYRPVGNLEWATADELPARVERLRSWGYAARDISRAEAAALEPALRALEDASGEDAPELAFFPEEGFVLAGQLIARLITAAKSHGATVITSEPVVGFDLRGVRIVAARLGSGERLCADEFVCCAGWQTAQLAALAGASVPLVSPDSLESASPALVAYTAPAPFRVRRVLHTPDVNIRPTEGGQLLLEAGDLNRLAHASTPSDQVAGAAAELLRRAARILPAHAMALERAQVCIRPLPTDGYPIVGWAREVERCYIMVTHSGITLAPYLAILAAGELCDREPAFALAPYRPNRFARL